MHGFEALSLQNLAPPSVKRQFFGLRAQLGPAFEMLPMLASWNLKLHLLFREHFSKRGFGWLQLAPHPGAQSCREAGLHGAHLQQLSIEFCSIIKWTKTCPPKKSMIQFCFKKWTDCSFFVFHRQNDGLQKVDTFKGFVGPDAEFLQGWEGDRSPRDRHLTSFDLIFESRELEFFRMEVSNQRWWNIVNQSPKRKGWVAETVRHEFLVVFHEPLGH
jgi:hypothetical protein